jgi:hypothetical protein
MVRAKPERRARTAALIVLALGATAQILAYWPGLMTWDAIRQYHEALVGHYDDWHPPAMDWLWQQLRAFHKGPAPMLVLQLALYWAGYAGLALFALRERRRGLAIGLVIAALLPIPLALMGAVLKDCLMAGALMAATALLVWMPARGGWAMRIAGLALLVAAATLRFNALPACLPLAVALFPADWRRGWWRLSGIALACALVIAAALPLANRALKAEPSGVGLSLVIFDLGGITYHSGVDVFPDLDVQHRVAVNAHCYSPVKWDVYAFWSPTPCPIQFDDIQDAFADSGENPYRHWAGAALAHPIAYAEHRLAHFNINTRFLVHDEIERPVQVESAPNPWNYRVAPNAALGLIDTLALWTAHSPLGWPIWWMALALGTLIVAPRLPSRSFIVPVALSGLLYGLGYLPASVASELRYHLWTMLAAGIAALFAASDLAGGAEVSRQRLIAATAGPALVALLCTIWRLT